MSSTRQAVTRGESFTGCGKRPDLTPAHQQDFLTGISAGMGGVALGLPMMLGRRRNPVSGSRCMVSRPCPSYDGAILIFPIRGKAEFGILKTEFGNASLFLAGFQCVGDFRKCRSDGAVIYMRPKIVGHFHDALRRTARLRVKSFIFAKRRNDG